MPRKDSPEQNDSANSVENLTIEVFAKRSNTEVTGWTLFLAMAGAMADILSHALSGIRGGNPQFPMLWGLWIPLCFITIPPIHYLCRHVRKLESRLAELEQQSLKKPAA